MFERHQSLARAANNPPKRTADAAGLARALLTIVYDLSGHDPKTMRVGVMSSVFVSYAREDSDAAKRLAYNLRELGEEPWLDQEMLTPGQHWPTVVEEAIRAADFFIAILSPEAVEKRGFVQKEVHIALDVLEQTSPTEVFIVPVRLAECKSSHRALLELQWVDLFPDWDSGIQNLQRLFGFALRQGTLGDLSGTIWAAQESLVATWNLVFEDGLSVLSYNHESGFRETGSWRQEGEAVYAYFNQMSAQYRGRLEGDTIQGKAQNVLGQTWTWSGTKIQ